MDGEAEAINVDGKVLKGDGMTLKGNRETLKGNRQALKGDEEVQKATERCQRAMGKGQKDLQLQRREAKGAIQMHKELLKVIKVRQGGGALKCDGQALNGDVDALKCNEEASKGIFCSLDVENWPIYPEDKLKISKKIIPEIDVLVKITH